MVHVKICGITHVEDARAAIEAGADWLGFVFYPPSPRYVSPSRAQEIILSVRSLSGATRFVGVFVNEGLDHIRAVMETAGLDWVQLHGQEPPAMVSALSPRVYKALQPRDAQEADALLALYGEAVNGNRPAFIVDALPQKLPGGTGMRADWNLAYTMARQFPILLAGGLNAANVAEAIAAVQPWGVDVSSGVERAPGLKDHVKLREFIARAKSVE